MKFIVSLLFFFVISNTCFAQIDSTKSQNTDEVFMIVEQMPQFPGGQTAMMEYLGKNTEYPSTAQKDKVQGKVYVSFTVDKLGFVKDIKVIRGVREDLDNAAIDVVRKMPQWSPGMQRGKAVNVRYNLPISFKL